MDRLEDMRVNEMEALAQEAIREPESVWVQRPERQNCGRFGESSIMERMSTQVPWKSCVCVWYTLVVHYEQITGKP
jgi:hypothetical protein